MEKFSENLNILWNSLQAISAVCVLLLIGESCAQLRGIVPVINRDRDAVAVKHIYEPNADGSYVYR